MLVGVQLRFDVAPDIKLVVGRQARDGAGVLPVAAPHAPETGQRTVIPGALPQAVEPFGAAAKRLAPEPTRGRSRNDELGQRPAPFAHDGPFVCIPQRRALRTRRLDVPRGRQIDFALTENLIPVHVQHDVILAGPGAHEPIPVFNPLKRIMENHHGISLRWLQTNGVIVPFEVKIFHQIHIQGEPKGFVDELDRRHDIGLRGITLHEPFDGIHRLSDGIALLPVDGTRAARVVVTVLRTGS